MDAGIRGDVNANLVVANSNIVMNDDADVRRIDRLVDCGLGLLHHFLETRFEEVMKKYVTSL